MQVPNISTVPLRPQVKRMSRKDPHRSRMSQKDHHKSRISNDMDSSSLSNRWLDRRQSQVTQEIYNPWRPVEVPARNLDNNEEKEFFCHRGWFYLFGGVFCLILVIAIVAIVLGIVLPMTKTNTSDSGATPKMVMVNSETSESTACSDTDRGLIALLNGSIPSGWTLYSHNYSATKTVPTLMFGFETDGAHIYYLDAVSVVDNSASSIELLTNPSFEDSTINVTGWTTSCESTCANQIVSGSQCFGSSGNCFMAYCSTGHSSIFFLSQSFMATIGNTYTISYMLDQAGNSSTGIMTFYLDVI